MEPPSVLASRMRASLSAGALISCGIYYTGGQAALRLQNTLADIDPLCSTEAGNNGLGEYGANAWPAQHWRAYHRKRMALREHLERLLQPSTSAVRLAEQTQARLSVVPTSV